MRGPTGTVLVRCALVVGLLIVPGCTDDPEQPGTLPTRSPSPTPTTTSASPATPEEEVEAAVRAYYAELTRAAQTNDTSQLQQMTTRGCPCRRPVRIIKGFADRGWTAPDAEFLVTLVNVRDADSRQAVVEVKTADAAYTVIDRSGSVVDKIDGRTTHVDLSLVRTPSNTWIIANEVDLKA
jgi:hypothetical protein